MNSPYNNPDRPPIPPYIPPPDQFGPDSPLDPYHFPDNFRDFFLEQGGEFAFSPYALFPRLSDSNPWAHPLVPPRGLKATVEPRTKVESIPDSNTLTWNSPWAEPLRRFVDSPQTQEPKASDTPTTKPEQQEPKRAPEESLINLGELSVREASVDTEEASPSTVYDRVRKAFSGKKDQTFFYSDNPLRPDVPTQNDGGPKAPDAPARRAWTGPKHAAPDDADQKPADTVGYQPQPGQPAAPEAEASTPVDTAPPAADRQPEVAEPVAAANQVDSAAAATTKTKSPEAPAAESTATQPRTAVKPESTPTPAPPAQHETPPTPEPASAARTDVNPEDLEQDIASRAATAKTAPSAKVAPAEAAAPPQLEPQRQAAADPERPSAEPAPQTSQSPTREERPAVTDAREEVLRPVELERGLDQKFRPKAVDRPDSAPFHPTGSHSSSDPGIEDAQIIHDSTAPGIHNGASDAPASPGSPTSEAPASMAGTPAVSAPPSPDGFAGQPAAPDSPLGSESAASFDGTGTASAQSTDTQQNAAGGGEAPADEGGEEPAPVTYGSGGPRIVGGGSARHAQAPPSGPNRSPMPPTLPEATEKEPEDEGGKSPEEKNSNTDEKPSPATSQAPPEKVIKAGSDRSPAAPRMGLFKTAPPGTIPSMSKLAKIPAIIGGALASGVINAKNAVTPHEVTNVKRAKGIAGRLGLRFTANMNGKPISITPATHLILWLKATR